MNAQSESRRVGILRLRHLQEVNEAKGEEMVEAAPRFARLADKASAAGVVVAHQLFQTPEPLAARVVALATADGRELGRVLEPSAGLGRIYRAVRAVAPSAPVTLVDIAPDCCGELYRATEGDPTARLVAGDFLTMGAARLGTFDTVVMNPPFTRGSDIAHIRHALTLLAPGGVLVAICAGGPKQRAALKPIATTWEDLPAGSFKSEGTNVAAALVTIQHHSHDRGLLSHTRRLTFTPWRRATVAIHTRSNEHGYLCLPVGRRTQST